MNRIVLIVVGAIASALVSVGWGIAGIYPLVKNGFTAEQAVKPLTIVLVGVGVFGLARLFVDVWGRDVPSQVKIAAGVLNLLLWFYVGGVLLQYTPGAFLRFTVLVSMLGAGFLVEFALNRIASKRFGEDEAKVATPKATTPVVKPAATKALPAAPTRPQSNTANSFTNIGTVPGPIVINVVHKVQYPKKPEPPPPPPFSTC